MTFLPKSLEVRRPSEKLIRRWEDDINMLWAVGPTVVFVNTLIKLQIRKRGEGFVDKLNIRFSRISLSEISKL
jgi:hypothetical protein